MQAAQKQHEREVFALQMQATIRESRKDGYCPHCGKPINAAAMLGSISTPAKAQAARENAKLGGWPKGKKRGKRKRVARRRNAGTQRPGDAEATNATRATPPGSLE